MDDNLNKIIELLNSRLLSTEIIVNQLFDTLVEKGLIDEDEFQQSIDVKVAEINKIIKKHDKEDTPNNLGNLFNGPIGEA